MYIWTVLCKKLDHTHFLQFVINAFEISKSVWFQILQQTPLIFKIVNLLAIIWSIIVKCRTHENQYDGINNSKMKKNHVV